MAPRAVYRSDSVSCSLLWCVLWHFIETEAEAELLSGRRVAPPQGLRPGQDESRTMRSRRLRPRPCAVTAGRLVFGSTDPQTRVWPQRLLLPVGDAVRPRTPLGSEAEVQEGLCSDLRNNLGARLLFMVLYTINRVKLVRQMLFLLLVAKLLVLAFLLWKAVFLRLVSSASGSLPFCLTNADLPKVPIVVLPAELSLVFSPCSILSANCIISYAI